MPSTFGVEIPSAKWFGPVPTEVLGLAVRGDGVVQNGPYLLDTDGSRSYHRDEASALQAAGERVRGGGAFRVWLRVLSIGDQAHIYRLVQAREVQEDPDYLFSLLETLEILGETVGIEKSTDPLDPVEFHKFVVRLLRAWAPEIAQISGAYTETYISEIEKEDWSSMSKEEIDKRFEEIGEIVPKQVYAVAPRMMQDGGRFNYEIELATREGMIKATGMEVDQTFNLRDTRAIRALSNWSYKQIPTSYSGISQQISTSLKNELVKTLETGQNFREVVRDFMKQVPVVATRKQIHIMDVTAQNALARARSHSQLTTYRDARVTVVRVASVLDDRTTPQCMFLHDKIISVEPVLQYYGQEVSKDDDPRDAFPWVKSKKDKATGDEWLEFTANGKTERFAEKTAGGDMEFKKGWNMDKLTPFGVGFPPYHALCRTTTYVSTESL